MPRLLLILLHLIAAGHATATGPATTFNEANTHYEAGDFAAARDTYQSLIDAGNLAPDVFFNLANTHYRLDENGLASLNYRRAAALSRWPHLEAAQNLRFLRRELGFLQPGQDTTSQIASLVPSRIWAIALTAAAWITVLSLTALVCLRRRNLPLLASVAVAGIIVSAIATTALVSLEYKTVSPADIAVVTTPGHRVLTAPLDGAGTVSDLPPGSAVHLLQQRGPWYYTAVDNDTRGWVHSSVLEPLWPYDHALLP